MLEELGLPADAVAMYAQLVRTPSAALTELTGAVPMDSTDARGALDLLERLALASRSETGGEDRWTAVPPLLTGQQMLIERAQRLLETQRELLVLAEEHQRVARAGGADHVVEVVLGEQAVRAQVRRLLASTTDEVLALVKPPFVAIKSGEAAANAAALRGRVVYDQSAFDDDDRLMDVLRSTARPDDLVRVHPAVPMRLQIYDRRVAAVPVVRHDAQPSVLLVHPSGLLTLAIEFFEAVWDRAVPIPLDAPGAVGEPVGDRLAAEDQQVLGLLLAGNTDVSVARQLDRSLRWVQRRVRLMMDAAGVRTRLQLGWEAKRRGWLDDGADALGHPPSHLANT